MSEKRPFPNIPTNWPALAGPRKAFVSLSLYQISKYPAIQGSNAKILKCLNAKMLTCQKKKSTENEKYRKSKVQKMKSTENQKHRKSKVQKIKSTEN